MSGKERHLREGGDPSKPVKRLLEARVLLPEGPPARLMQERRR